MKNYERLKNKSKTRKTIKRVQNTKKDDKRLEF